MKTHKEYPVYFQQALPTALSAALMSSGAGGLLLIFQPLVVEYIPNYALPLAQIIAGTFIAWFFAHKKA